MTNVELNGTTVPAFGDLNNNKLAVVDLNVLTKLCDLLPKANFYQIKKEHLSNVDINAQSLEDFTQILEDELRFHRSVNEIVNYNKPIMA